MKRQGFTLIELLAVIVILAVIALIATPMILGVIESSKKGAAESSVQGYIKAIEQYYVTSQLTGIEHYPTSVHDLNGLVDVKGDKPSKGYVTLDEAHTIVSGEFCVNNYYVFYDGTYAKVDSNKKCEEISGEAVLAPESCFYFSDGTIMNYYDYENNNSDNPACPKRVIIPNEIGGVAVTKIGSGAFSEKGLSKVILPDSIIYIESAAFYRNELTSITFPSKLVTIDKNAFTGNRLTSIVIPDNVKELVSEAFSENQLTSVKIKGKSAASDFTYYGPDLWGWKVGFSDANIEWNA